METKRERDLIERELRWGCEHFNEGRYWEAHEAWEHAWNALGRPRGVQAVIQLAAVGHHLGRGTGDPAARLVRLALEKWDDQSVVQIAGGREWLERAARGGELLDALKDELRALRTSCPKR